MGLRKWQKQYYLDMVDAKRGFMIVLNGRLVAVITFLIGDDDDKYLFFRKPWTCIEDDPTGTTIYIDQFITKERTSAYIHKEFSKILKKIKRDFPNVRKAKWLRASALFRKKGVRDDKAKVIVHCKNIK